LAAKETSWRYYCGSITSNYQTGQSLENHS